MWKNQFHKNRYRCMAVWILGAALLGGCNEREELFLLKDPERIQEDADEEASLAEPEDLSNKDSDSILETIIFVHVCGAVKMPGVVQIPEGSRAQAAVDAAGGFLEIADTTYVNLAAPIEDGEQLYIPTLEEAGEWRRNQAAAQSGKVNLNTADVRLLCTLPGIGESRAKDIIAYRQKNGDFSEKEQIKQVPGIKDSIYEEIKDLIVLK